MSTESKIYLVIFQWADWDSHDYRIMGTFLDESKAESHKEFLQSQIEDIKRMHKEFTNEDDAFDFYIENQSVIEKGTIKVVSYENGFKSKF